MVTGGITGIGSDCRWMEAWFCYLVVADSACMFSSGEMSSRRRCLRIFPVPDLGSSRK